jgi:hypothetical protein
MERAGWNYPPGEMRVSDADRDQALGELSLAFKAGRLTPDELDQRSGQALAARTGDELTALLADLPLDDAIAARSAAVERANRARGTRVAIAASAALAFLFTLSSLAGAVKPSLSPQQRALAREMMIHQGLRVPPGFPPNPGFDWVGVAAPGIIAALLVVLIVCLRVRLARANRP